MTLEPKQFSAEHTYRDRMQAEFDALDEKIDKLDRFIGYDPVYQDLDNIQRGLLVIQRDAMRSYAACLSLRLEFSKEKVDA